MPVKENTKPTYTAFSDFSFKLNRRTYAAKEGEVFSPPEELKEIPIDPGMPGVKFQYSSYLTTQKEEDGTKEEMEIPHYMILPLTKS